jgi:hypothetical protein
MKCSIAKSTHRKLSTRLHDAWWFEAETLDFDNARGNDEKPSPRQVVNPPIKSSPKIAKLNPGPSSNKT